MLTMFRRLLARFRRKTEPAPMPDPDGAPLSFDQTRSLRYWSARDARYRKPTEDRDGFAPRGWRL